MNNVLISKTPDRPYLDEISCCAYSLFSLMPPLLETTANMDILRKMTLAYGFLHTSQ